jgi:sialic acid synthase SpsE/sugar phosphate isomerase/epimerase/CBS domain-containing protein
MNIITAFSKYVVFSEDTLLSALNKMNSSGVRSIFAVSESGHLEGVLTDGDFRRWLTGTDVIDLNTPVSKVYNTEYVFYHNDDPREQIAKMLGNRITIIPLVDRNHRVTAVALEREVGITIDGCTIDDESETFIIAEIGNNHNGSYEAACNLVDHAVEAGASCAKFQMRDLERLYSNGDKEKDSGSDLGTEYTLDLLRKFQLSPDTLFRVFDHCRARGIIPLCTPWDISSLGKLEAYGLPAYKISSADFTNHDLMSAVARTGKPMICSTGMATEAEIHDGIRHLKVIGASYVLLHCNSTYPTPFKDVNLSYITHLQKLSGGFVGYSGHERDIFVPVAAVALGAKVIEKHITIDKSLEGNDHKVSLLPLEFHQMVLGIRQIDQSLGRMQERVLSQGELMNRETLAKSLVAACDIPSGVAMTDAMIEIRSPGQGLQPNRRSELVGHSLTNPKLKGDIFFPADISEDNISARNYSFPFSWGIPVRYHDLHNLAQKSNVKMLEIHLSYKDIDLDFRTYLNKKFDIGLAVHSPELFAGDHTLDLCAEDEDYRNRSIRELQRVIDLTRELKAYFTQAERPCIVVNVGGFSHLGHLGVEKRAHLYDHLEASLNKIDAEGVEIIAQTMPPFPWHFGGQQFHNLFVDAEGILEFHQRTGLRVCLDVSHSKLACNYTKASFDEFLRSVMPVTAHLHLADASGVDGEGLQIGEGEIDWSHVFKLYETLCPSASFIPEIWQGHKNEGEGGWRALERLEAACNPVAAEVVK